METGIYSPGEGQDTTLVIQEHRTKTVGRGVDPLEGETKTGTDGKMNDQDKPKDINPEGLTGSVPPLILQDLAVPPFPTMP